MKKIIIPALLLAAFQGQAQDMETARKQLYYERYVSAANSFRQILASDPDNGEAMLGLTEALIHENKTAEAKWSLLQAPSKLKEDPFYNTAYGMVLLQEKKTDSAAQVFGQALKETKEKNPAVLAGIARAHNISKAGDGLFSVSLMQKAVERQKNDPYLITLLGDAYRKAGNGSEAYKAYRTIIENHSGYAKAYHRTGEIFLSQKNKDLYLEYFTRAINADPLYAPSLYQLYSHYFYHDAAKALDYYNQYASKSDVSLQTEYDRTDLFYLNKDYQKAIDNANVLIAKQNGQVKPRLFKLLSYSYTELKDTARAIAYMQQYFANEDDSNLIAKDFESMALLYTTPQRLDSALYFLDRAASMQKDSTALYAFYKKIATSAGQQKDYAAQARWMGLYYNGNEKASNVDLFNWALAAYRAEDFVKADSVFGLYVAKYPEQSFGYYWQARANTALDKEMKEGRAVPHYQKLIEVLKTDTANANYKKWMIEALGYLAAYEANTQKDYAEAVTYFEQVLAIDPANEDAKKYIEVLQNDAAKNDGK